MKSTSETPRFALFFATAMLLCLTGCGQMGPLYLPKPPPPKSTKAEPPPPPATVPGGVTPAATSPTPVSK